MSRFSTEQGPAIIVSEPSPMTASSTRMTVSSGRNSRDVSLNGRLIGVTRSTPARVERCSTRAGLRPPISPTTAITTRSFPTWSNGVSPSARIWLLTPRTSASLAPTVITTNIALRSPRRSAKQKSRGVTSASFARHDLCPRSYRPGTFMPGIENRSSGPCVCGVCRAARPMSTRVGLCQCPRHDGLDDVGLGVRVVLDVLPLSGGEVALRLLVQRPVVVVTAEPITERQHPVDLCRPDGEDVDVRLGIRSLEQPVLEPLGLADAEHVARALHRRHVGGLLLRVRHRQ